MTRKKPKMERLSLLVEPELKQALRKQAKRAGLSVSEWVRTRLELEGTDPDEVRAFLEELVKVGKQVKRDHVKFEARRAEWEARVREMPARQAAIRAKTERETRAAIERGEFDPSRLFGGEAPR